MFRVFNKDFIMAQTNDIITTGSTPQITMAISDFIKIPEIPINRRSVDRVNKMLHTFNGNYNANMARLLSIVHVGIVITDFVDIDTGHQYKSGEQYILDGNTRKSFWEQYPDTWEKHPNGLTAIIYPLENFAQVRRIYESLDSSTSAKNVSEKIQGEFNRQKFYPTQPLLIRGNFAVALKWSHRGPKEPELKLEEQIKVSLPALREFDRLEAKVLVNGKQEVYTISRPRIVRLASAPIYAAIMTALRLFPNSSILHDFIEKFITQDENSVREAINSKRVTPYEIIAIEWLEWSDQRSKHKNDAPLWLDGHAGQTSTKFQKKQLDFLLHWIQQYLDNPNYTVTFSNGIKSTAWGKIDSSKDSVKNLIGGWESFYVNANKTKKSLTKLDISKAYENNFTSSDQEKVDILVKHISNSDKKTLELF